MAMIGKFVQFYNQSKLKMIEFVTESKENIFYENGFLEESDVYIQIEITKENIAKIEKEIQFQAKNNNKDTLKKLIIERENEKMNFIYLASNNIEYVDRLIAIINPKNNFYSCLLALSYYNHGNKKEACSLLERWLGNKSYFENHFLLNLIFSDLILGKDISKAYKCLQEAVRLRPENKLVHEKLLNIYKILNNKSGIKTENSILSLLS